VHLGNHGGRTIDYTQSEAKIAIVLVRYSMQLTRPANSINVALGTRVG
jgi:hypothetical protein